MILFKIPPPPPSTTPRPSYAKALKTQAEDLSNSELCSLAEQYLQDDEQTALAIQGTREEELPGYSNDERTFLTEVVRKVRIRPDNMIELPLPFKEAKPKFPYTRGIALKRTENAFKSMRKDPEFFQKTLDKFSINVDRETPRFEPLPPEYRYNKEGHA